MMIHILTISSCDEVVEADVLFISGSAKLVSEFVSCEPLLSLGHGAMSSWTGEKMLTAPNLTVF